MPEDLKKSIEGNCGICAEGYETEPAVYCKDCDTPHHKDCWEYNGRCSVFGCEKTGYKTDSTPNTDPIILGDDMNDKPDVVVKSSFYRKFREFYRQSDFATQLMINSVIAVSVMYFGILAMEFLSPGKPEPIKKYHVREESISREGMMLVVHEDDKYRYYEYDHNNDGVADHVKKVPKRKLSW